MIRSYLRYKCRRCNQVTRRLLIKGGFPVDAVPFGLARTKLQRKLESAPYTTHECDDGGLGVTDLIGVDRE